MKEELQLLFHVLRDALLQEARQRRLAQLVTGEDFSLTNEREIGISSSLAFYLRSVGFPVQLDAYFMDENPRRRPDYGVWLPASRRYAYFEVKQIAWGCEWQYYFSKAIEDIKKLASETDPQNK